MMGAIFGLHPPSGGDIASFIRGPPFGLGCACGKARGCSGNTQQNWSPANCGRASAYWMVLFRIEERFGAVVGDEQDLADLRKRQAASLHQRAQREFRYAIGLR